MKRIIAAFLAGIAFYAVFLITVDVTFATLGYDKSLDVETRGWMLLAAFALMGSGFAAVKVAFVRE